MEFSVRTVQKNKQVYPTCWVWANSGLSGEEDEQNQQHDVSALVCLMQVHSQSVQIQVLEKGS